MGTFIATNPDGSIHTKYIGLTSEEGKSLHKTAKMEISDPEQLRALQRGKLEGCYVEKGKVHEKATITLISDKALIASDGQDRATVRMANVPKGFSKVKLWVSGPGEITLDRGDSIVLDCDTTQYLFVKVMDPRLRAKELIIKVEDQVVIDRENLRA